MKEAVLPFSHCTGVNTLLGPEMRSTGEDIESDKSFHRAFLEAQLGAGTVLPHRAGARGLGLNILATRGTAAVLTENAIESRVDNKA